MHDAVASGRSIRVLNVIEAYTRESLAMEVDSSFAGLHVTRVLDEIIAERGLPQASHARLRTRFEIAIRHIHSASWLYSRHILSTRRTCDYEI